MQCGEPLARGTERAAHINRAAGVFYHRHLEALLLCVFGGVTDTEIEREAGEKNAREAARAQITGKPGWSPAIVLLERRIGIDLPVEPFAQQKLRMGNVQ